MCLVSSEDEQEAQLLGQGTSTTAADQEDDIIVIFQEKNHA